MVTTEVYFYQWTIPILADNNREELMALLFALGISGIEEEEKEIIASGPMDEALKDAVETLILKSKEQFHREKVQQKNWNAIWEDSFSPVIVENFAAVRASFHEPVAEVEHDLIITPKMSFGTGHHPTTWLCIRAMSEIDFVEKTVIDFGTGTGVLAILAEKLGAASISAFDIDEWSIENAKENIVANQCSSISLVLADSPSPSAGADILLANINRHIILDQMKQMTNVTKSNGIWLLSGLLTSDEQLVLEKCSKMGMSLLKSWHKDGWIAIMLTKASLC